VRKRRWQIQVGLASMLWLLAAAHGQGADVLKDVQISVVPMASIKLGGQTTYHGYREIRIALTNRHATQERTVTFSLPGTSYGRSGGHSIARMTQQVTLAPGAGNIIVSLMQPPVPFYGDRITVSIGGASTTLNVDLAEHAPPHQASYGSAMPAAVLLSRAIDNAYRNALLTRASHSGDPDTCHQTELPIAQWSTQFLTYTRYDGIVLDAKEIAQAPAEVVEALRQYVSAGGTLVVMGAWSPPATWPARRSQTQAAAVRYSVGFGHAWAMNESDTRRISRTTNALLESSIRDSLGPFSVNESIEDANRNFEVVGEIRVPVRALLILMIVFAVLIGPVNLYVLARKQRRMWMLWTVPAFSLVTCGLIWVVNVFAEGFSTQQRSAVVTLLDQRTKTATSLGMTAFYAPLAPGDGLRFSRETEVTPQVGIYVGHHGDGWSRTMNWGDDQHLSGGWIKSRLPAHFKLRKSQTLIRERLNFAAQPDGTIRVVNSLGSDITSIVYADAEGHAYSAGAVAAGQSATLTRDKRLDVTDRLANLRNIYSRRWAAAANALQRMPGEALLPNGYVAHLADSPFLETGLEDTEHRIECVVIGLVDELPTATAAAP